MIEERLPYNNATTLYHDADLFNLDVTKVSKRGSYIGVLSIYFSATTAKRM